MNSIQGHILTPQGFVHGTLHHAGGRISAIEGSPVEEAQARASTLPLLLPGFIDLHVHGGGGFDTMGAGDAARHIAGIHARHGTTALLATTMTAPLDEIENALRALAPLCQARPTGTARAVTTARLLDIDDIGPMQSQLIGCKWSRQRGGGGNHAQSRAGLCRIRLTHCCALP
jgi:imidazolonepropionase-like amidohydrolase